MDVPFRENRPDHQNSWRNSNEGDTVIASHHEFELGRTGVMMSNVEQRELGRLKKHLVNADIYGDQVDPEFVASIKNLGVLVPLTILPDGTVISGHRRFQAAKIARLQTVPVIVRSDLTDPDEIERALIESNRQREKSNETKAREAQRLLAIEQRAAEKRQQASQLAGRDQNGSPIRNASSVVERVTPPKKQGDSSNFGKTRDAVGKMVGLSGPSVDAAVQVIEKIDAAKAAGDTETAEHLTETLNKKGIRTALRAMHQSERAAVEPQPETIQESDSPYPQDHVAQALALRPKFEQHTHTLRNWMQQVRQLVGQPGSIYLGENKLEEIKCKVQNVVAAFTSAKPHARCPYCLGKGCKMCREAGYVTKFIFDNAPEAKRQAALQQDTVAPRTASSDCSLPSTDETSNTWLGES